MTLFHPVARPQPPPPPPPPPPPTHLSMNFWKIFPLKLSQISTMYGCKGGETHKQHLRPGFSQWTFVSKSSVYCSGGWTGPRVTDVQILFGSALLKASAAFPFACCWSEFTSQKLPLNAHALWQVSSKDAFMFTLNIKFEQRWELPKYTGNSNRLMSYLWGESSHWGSS